MLKCLNKFSLILAIAIKISKNDLLKASIHEPRTLKDTLTCTSVNHALM